jgi:type I restriction enzyme S subunit
MKYREITIGKICLPTEQKDPRLAPETSFEYIDISSIDREQKIIAATTTILGKDAPSRARKIVQSGDVLVSTVRPNLNAVAIVPPKLDRQIASTGFCVLRPNSKILDSRYLYYRTLTFEFIDYLTARMRGANYPAVTDGVVKDVSIPLPPLSEQRRIVEILDQADDLRKKRADANAKAERILPALFYKIFGDPATNPKRLCKKKLGDLIKVKSGEFLPVKSMDSNGSYPVYGGNGINGYHSEYMFEKPIIVIGRVGAYCGSIHYAEPKSWVTDNALYVSEMSNDLHIKYLAAALRMANLNQYAGRAGQPLISASRIYPVEILVPDFEAQNQYAVQSEVIEQYAQNRQGSREKIDNLFLILLHRAFSGDLTAKWREANTKELLAEMEEQAKIIDAKGLT